jgi:hypothetical protein
MDENGEKATKPRVPSDIRIVYALLMYLGTLLLLLWLYSHLRLG